MDELLLYGLIVGRPDPIHFKVVGKYLTIEPLAIIQPPQDPAFKKVVDDEMHHLTFSGEACKIFDRWLMQPIPPKNTALKMPIDLLTREYWKYLTGTVHN